MHGDGYKTYGKNNNMHFIRVRRQNIFSRGCHTALGLTSYTAECNSSMLYNYTSTRQRAGKLLHVWACVLERSATMTAGVGCGFNKASWALFVIGEQEWQKKRERERRKHREQKSHRGRQQEGCSGRRALDGKYHTTVALLPPRSKLGKVFLRPSMPSDSPRSLTLLHS